MKTSPFPETQHRRVSSLEDTSVVTFIDKLVNHAIECGTSDIHFEPFEDQCRVRFRKDSLLYEVSSLPKHLSQPMTSRIKVMAQMDITEHRIPQDGQFSFKVSSQKIIECRVSTCPTLYGEKIVIRLIDASKIQLESTHLGMTLAQTNLFHHMLEKPQGMILAVGPTGSGKTLTLYHALHYLNHIQRNINTIEDPVEIHLPGINQTHVHPKSGLTFAKALRGFLRQDPDILMVGEIRDLETAEIAFKAAETGHLVLSTLHANNALETINRLYHLGIAPHTLAFSLKLIIAQRLLRKLCPHCSSHTLSSSKDLKKISHCKACYQGYQGRTGIFELLPIPSSVVEALTLNSIQSLENILHILRKESYITLEQSALNLIQTGITSLEEVQRILGDSHNHGT